MNDPEKTHETPAGHERLFWRKLAYWGATRGPEWWVRYSPPPFGWAAALLVPHARKVVAQNLRTIRGPVSPLRDAKEVLETFGTYASCLAEVLSNDSPRGPRSATGVVLGERWVREAVRMRKGIVLATAHTAGWESAGPLLSRALHEELILVMHQEPDARAGRLQDHARLRTGVRIVHVGDPLASLPLLQHLRSGGLVGLQLDRIVPGMRTIEVDLLGARGHIPEGPLRLAQLSGAPILPIFCARRGFRDYVIQVFAPVLVERRARPDVVTEAAQHLATSMSSFLRAHPTQWFQFGGG